MSREGSPAPARSGCCANLCFDCERYYGGCSWSEVDPATDRIRFQPVPGWVTRKCTICIDDGSFVVVEQVVHCPLFIRTPDRVVSNPGELSLDQLKRFLAWERRKKEDAT